MREGIIGADLDLLLGTGLRFFRVRVKRPEEVTWTNLSELAGGDWVLKIRAEGESPDQPASRFTFALLHSAGGDSIAPGISTSPHNIDAALAFRPLIHPGRDVEISVAVIASGTPVSGDWKPWLRGQIEDGDWPGLEVTASCLTLDGVLIQTQMEVEEDGGAESPGTPVEDEIQRLLDRWMGTGVVPLRVIGSPSWNVGVYRPKGSLGNQVLALAQQNGWDVRYRWSQADTDFVLTLYEPPRDKTVPDLVLAANEVHEVPGLKESRQFVRNAFSVEYKDSASQTRELALGEDPASITEYGRLFMGLVEDDVSAIDSEARALALIDYAKHDLAWPPVDGRYSIPFIPWLELGDLLEIAADDQHFDYDSNFAVVGLSHEVDSETGASSVFDGRANQPIGMQMGWFKRKRPVDLGNADEILNFREIARTTTQIKYAWTLGSALAMSVIHDYRELQPYSVDKWPAEDRLPDSVSSSRDVEYTVPVPEQGQVGYFQVEGRRADGQLKDMERVLLFPTNVAADYIAFAAVTVDQTDGSVRITGWTTDRALSVAYAYNVGAAVSTDPPTQAHAEAQGAGAAGGGLVTGFTSDFEITLPAGTVDFGEVIKGLLIAYMNANGTGPDGSVTDHDTPVGFQGERFKITVPDQLATGVVIANKLTESSKRFGSDIVFSATDWDTVAWTAGTITMADLTTYAIAAGNTGNLASDARRYIYLDPAVSVTVLQITTAIATATGENKVLVCEVARAVGGASSGQGAHYVPVVGAFFLNGDQLSANAITDIKIATDAITTTKISDNSISTPKLIAGSITTAKLDALAVTADKIAANTITASKIAAGTITAAEIAANTITAGKMNVAWLSAIAVDAGTITAGLLQNAAGTRFIDLDASGANPFIKHDALELLADGTADFSGVVSADSFLASEAIFSGLVSVDAGQGSHRIRMTHSSGYGLLILNDSAGDFAGQMLAVSGRELLVQGHNGVRIMGGSTNAIGFYGASPVTKPTVTGSRGGNAALASLLSALAGLGLLTDSSS